MMIADGVIFFAHQLSKQVFALISACSGCD
jgi:hypothetical protein